MYFYAIMILCILFGCFCSLTFDITSLLGILVSVCFIFAIKIIVFRKKSFLNILTLVLIMAFSLGVFMGAFHYWKTFRDVDMLYGTKVNIEGVVTDQGNKFFELKTVDKIYTIYNFGEDIPKVNEYVAVEGVLQRHSVAPYPGGFNSRLYNALDGNVGYLTCDKVEVKGEVRKADLGVSVRNFIKDRVMLFKTSEQVKGFIIAVLIGDKDYLDDGTANDFALSGISHIVAISGLHVGIFLSLFLGISRVFSKKKIAKFVFALLLVLAYTLVVGGRASVIRAGIMAVLSVGFLCFRKRSDSVINLSTAGLIICIINPFYVANPGFILSFVATFIIVFYAEFLKAKWFTIPLIVWVMMLPLSIYYCNVFSLETVFVNVIAIPLMPFLVLFGYVGCVVPFVSCYASAVAKIILNLAGYFASIDWLHIYLPSTKPYQFVVWVILLIAFYMVLRKKSMILICSMFLLSVSVFVNGAFISTADDTNKISVNFINCGNFNMQHIQTDCGNNILINCSEDACEYALKYGIKEIYSVIITKSTPSHTKGLEKLCQRYDVKYAILPDGMNIKNLNLEKTEVLYYNYNSCNFKTDSVEFNFTKRGDSRCLLVKTFDDIIAIPVDKKLENIGAYTVVCVPYEAEGIGEFSAEYCIYSTDKNTICELGNKYITSVDGMVRMIFEKDREPLISIY